MKRTEDGHVVPEPFDLTASAFHPRHVLMGSNMYRWWKHCYCDVWLTDPLCVVITIINMVLTYFMVITDWFDTTNNNPFY